MGLAKRAIAELYRQQRDGELRVTHAQLQAYIRRNRASIVASALSEHALLPIDELTGTELAFAFGVEKSTRARGPGARSPGYSVQATPGSRPLGFVRNVLLRDVRFWVDPAAVARVVDSGSREVACYAIGTVVDPRSREGRRVLDAGMTNGLGFSLFQQGCFFDSKSRTCLRASKWAHLQEKNAFQTSGNITGAPYSPSRTPPDMAALSRDYDVAEEPGWRKHPRALEALAAGLEFT